jgi:hypothetical protein
LTAAGRQQMELFPYHLAKSGTAVGKTQDHVLPVRGENGKTYPETFGKTIDEPLDFFVIENIQFLFHSINSIGKSLICPCLLHIL